MEQAKSALASLPRPRDWALLADRAAFRWPDSAAAAQAALAQNAAAFRVNYAYVVAGGALAGLFSDVAALLLALGGAALAAALLADTRVVGTHALVGVTPAQRRAAAAAVCAGAVLLSGAAAAAASGACVGAAACAAHGACYNDPHPDFV